MKSVYQTAIAVMTAAIGAEIALLSTKNDFYLSSYLLVSAVAFFASIIGAYMLMQSVAEKQLMTAGLCKSEIQEMIGLKTDWLKRLDSFLEEKFKLLQVLPIFLYYGGFLVAVWAFTQSLQT
ncbi:MAG TPA: hypothetical protein PLU46_00060 [Thiotrichales bacterium]|nr:hypothetical protein [Thiotrichales bacterium]